uniref:Uncharacterized protein n=1 Tax=Romanomermis culicivorax TaxID=13658 RepID=A0A915JGB9_ROMCU
MRFSAMDSPPGEQAKFLVEKSTDLDQLLDFGLLRLSRI